MPALEETLSAHLPRLGPTRLIAIDGRGGSGKSSLAELLAGQLAAEIVHTDDFASWDDPLDWHHALIERILDPIAGGAATLDYMPSKWWDNHHPQPVVGQPVTPVMILEGMGALQRELRSYVTFGIFVETPPAVCLERGLGRDLATGNGLEMLTALWAGWQQEEERYFCRDAPSDFADVVVDGTRPFTAQMRI